MNIMSHVRALGVILALSVSMLFSLAGARPAGAIRALPASAGTVVTWTGAAGDRLWSNPTNWQGGRMPGEHDAVRIETGAGDIQVDPDFAGQIGGLSIEPGYAGTLTLARSLTIRGDVTMSSGNLVGGEAPLVVEGSATVSGGVLTTPHSLVSAKTLTIAQGGVVRLGANGKLDLTGDGTPLTGDGLLDVTTNAPNSVEYTGHATSDLTAAGPAATLHGLAGLPVSGGTRSKADKALPLVPATFTETGSLTLNPGEDGLGSAVIDIANGYTYFGTGTSPGIVVKVRLSDFTRVGALTLNPGEDDLSSAVIDTTSGYAYFGTFTSPGIVVKIRLADFTRVGALVLNPGENELRSAVVDTANSYAYFGTTSHTFQPSVVVKVRLSDLTRVGALTMYPGEDYLFSAVIDTASGFAYFGGDIRVVKVRLSDFTQVGVLTLPAHVSSAVIDTTNGHAYFGTTSDTFQPSMVVKVRLSDFTPVSAL